MQVADLINAVADKTGLDKSKAKAVVTTVLDELGQALARGERVQLAGFGSFEVKERAERQGMNPQTKQPMTIPATKAATFKAASRLRDRIGGTEQAGQERTVGA